METGLAGRTALVSGGSKGIGKGIARSLAREGVSVALLARTEHEVLAAAQEIAGETGVTVVGVQADVTDTNSLKAAVAHLSGLASFTGIGSVWRFSSRSGPLFVRPFDLAIRPSVVFLASDRASYSGRARSA